MINIEGKIFDSFGVDQELYTRTTSKSNEITENKF